MNNDIKTIARMFERTDGGTDSLRYNELNPKTDRFAIAIRLQSLSSNLSIGAYVCI